MLAMFYFNFILFKFSCLCFCFWRMVTVKLCARITVVYFMIASFICHGLSHCNKYNNIVICKERESSSFTVNIYKISEKRLLTQQQIESLYFPLIETAILNHFKQSFDASLYLQDYYSPNVFWHGRNKYPNKIGPWFDDGDDGDSQHLWTVVLTKFVQNIYWCLLYAIRNLRNDGPFFNLSHDTPESGFIVVFQTTSNTTNNVEIAEWYELIEEDGKFYEKYEATDKIIARVGYPLPTAKRQMRIARSNGFKGEHSDSYIFNKKAQNVTALAILCKYRLVWHNLRLLSGKL